MVFRGEEKIKLGMKFYTFNNPDDEDEYDIFMVSKILENDKCVELTNLEKSELYLDTLESLEEYYDMLTQYSDYVVFLYRNKDDVITLLMTIEQASQIHNKFQLESWIRFMFPKKIELVSGYIASTVDVAPLVLYDYIPKSHFNRFITMFLKNQFGLNSREINNNLNSLWTTYMTIMKNRLTLIENNNDKIDLNQVVQDKSQRLPDSFFIEAEKQLNTYISSYDIYPLDDSVDLSKVHISYFVIYSSKDDVYYIVMYHCDDIRYSRNLKALNPDVVDFMVKKR